MTGLLNQIASELRQNVRNTGAQNLSSQNVNSIFTDKTCLNWMKDSERADGDEAVGSPIVEWYVFNANYGHK